MFLLILIFYVLSNALSFDYNKYSWVLKSNFNYNKPNQAILNIAYPASIAYYFVTIIPPNSNYTFQGKFLDKDIYELSLTVYDSDGNINYDYKSINTYNTNNYVNYTVCNTRLDVYYVLQRFYINLDVYNENDMINNLFNVYDNTNEFYLTKISKAERDYYSEMLYRPIQTLITWISPSANRTFSKFYLPGDFRGLFPDSNHFYLTSSPGIFHLFKVTGYFLPKTKFPYIDFITVDQNTVSTDNGIPFYKFLKHDNTYELYISTYDIDDEIIYNIDPEALILKWNKDNHNKVLIFRIIDYTNTGIANYTGPLSPKETKEIMYTFYPEITPIDIF
jgi:hypothetical protein